MESEFKVTRVWIIGENSHAELKGPDGFVSLHLKADAGLFVGQNFKLTAEDGKNGEGK